jgi:hypothetical protein
MVKLTGLWANKAKDGSTYYSGSLGAARVIILKNAFKREGSKDPDLNLFIAPKPEKAADPKEKAEASGDDPAF